MTIRHSISWWCFESLMPPEKLISTAVELGFDGIELVGQQHWDAIRDAGLDIAAVVGHESLGDGLNKVANHDRIEREIIENLKLAEKYSIRRLICFTGNRHGESDERGLGGDSRGITAGGESGGRGRRIFGARVVEQQSRPRGVISATAPHGG